MKTPPHSAFLVRCVAAAALLWVAGATLAAGTNPVPRAVFTDDPQSGKDPFFPTSTRRLRLTAQNPGTNAPPAQAAQILLKGISGSRDNRFALVNNVTFSVGESGDVKAGNQTVRIRCLEIRDRSVLIEIPSTGEVKELKLKEGL